MARINKLALVASIAMSVWEFHGKATSPDSPGGQDITPEEFVDFMEGILNRILQERGITDKRLVIALTDYHEEAEENG